MTRKELLVKALLLFLDRQYVGMCGTITKAIYAETGCSIIFEHIPKIFPLFNRIHLMADYNTFPYWWDINDVGRIKRIKAFQTLINDYANNEEDITKLIKKYSIL